MKILIEKPPIYDEALRTFNLNPDDSIVFTYGDTLYNPNNAKITADLIRHEETHMEQQQYDRSVANVWYQRYFADANFRMEQEIEAYGEQYKFICQTVKDKNKRSKYLWAMAKDLSGTMYGNCIKFNEALKRIRNYASGKDLVDIELHIKDESGVEL